MIPPRPTPEQLEADRLRRARRREALVAQAGAHTESAVPVRIPAQRTHQSAPVRAMPHQRTRTDLAGRPVPSQRTHGPRTRPLPIGYDVSPEARRHRARVFVSVVVIAGCGLVALAVLVTFVLAMVSVQ